MSAAGHVTYYTGAGSPRRAPRAEISTHRGGTRRSPLSLMAGEFWVGPRDSPAVRECAAASRHETPRQPTFSVMTALTEKGGRGMRETVVAVIIRCDSCLSPARDLVGRVQQWASFDSAVSQLSDPGSGWLVSAEMQICPRCLARIHCSNTGHDWNERAEVAALSAADDVAARLCARCGEEELVGPDCLVRRREVRGVPR